VKRRKRLLIAAGLLAVILPAIRFGPHLLFAGDVITPRGEFSATGNVSRRPITFRELDFYFYRRSVDAEEVRFSVPESRRLPERRQLELHYIRFPSTSKNPGSPIVYLAGGPGGSGTRTASDDRFSLFMKLREVADVIAFDQRGTVNTSPRPMCKGEWNYPLDKPLDSTTLRAAMQPYLTACAAALRDSFDLDAFNTRESADDLEALRVSLGAEKINLWGISYGTHLGLAYIRRYPDRVERAVLAGTEGPDDTYKLPHRIDQVLGRLDSAIKADPDARKVIPDLRASIRSTVKKLEAHPTVRVVDRRNVSRDVTLGPLDLLLPLFYSLNEKEGMERLPTRLVPTFSGDYTEIARFAVGYRLGQVELPMALSMDCASGASAARLEEINAQAAAALLGDVANLDIRARCASWPVTDLGDDYRSPLQSNVPVLFISGTFDARTPPVNALEAARRFTNASHFLIEGGGHDDDLLIATPRIGEAIARFLRDGGVPVKGVTLAPYRFKLP
jgi:pimeloyl-ACP methyl ester carboxylesterase